MAHFLNPSADYLAVDTPFTVSGGTIDGNQPTFDGEPMFEGSYIRVGALVEFRITVQFDNITSFGTGQYFLDLPFETKHPLMIRGGCLHRASNGNEYAINGHAFAGTKTLELTYTAGTGQDEHFDNNSPYNLQTSDYFHVGGSYIIAM